MTNLAEFRKTMLVDSTSKLRTYRRGSLPPKKIRSLLRASKFQRKVKTLRILRLKLQNLKRSM